MKKTIAGVALFGLLTIPGQADLQLTGTYIAQEANATEVIVNTIEESNQGIEVFDTYLGSLENQATGSIYPIYAYIIDTENRALQTAMFERVAMFSRLKEHVGSIVSKQEITQLREQNEYVNNTVLIDHNYTGAVLADFYNSVAEKEVNLREEEELLLDVLLDNNIIFGDPGSYAGQDYVSVVSITHNKDRIEELEHSKSHVAFHAVMPYASAWTYHFTFLPLEVQKGITEVLTTLGYETGEEALLVEEYQAQHNDPLPQTKEYLESLR